MKEVVHAINKAADRSAADSMVNRLVDALWGQLDDALARTVPKRAPSGRQKPSQIEVMEELVAGVRAMESGFRDFYNANADQDNRLSRRSGRMPSVTMYNLVKALLGKDGEPVGLLVLAAYLREDAPWLAEVLSHAHGDFRSVLSREDAEVLARRTFQTCSELASLVPLLRERVGGSPDNFHSLIELPMFLNSVLSQYVAYTGHQEGVFN